MSSDRFGPPVESGSAAPPSCAGLTANCAGLTATSKKRRRHQQASKDQDQEQEQDDGWIVPSFSTRSNNDSVQINSNFRLRAIKLLSTSLCNDVVLARKLELQIFQGTLDRGFAYGPKVTQLAANLSMNPNIGLKYSPDVLVLLDDKILSQGTPVEVWWKEHERKLEHQQRVLSEREEYEREEVDQNSSAVLVCGKCHSKSIEIEQKQTRGADEAMTVFCQCRSCGIRWRM